MEKSLFIYFCSVIFTLNNNILTKKNMKKKNLNSRSGSALEDNYFGIAVVFSWADA